MDGLEMIHMNQAAYNELTRRAGNRDVFNAVVDNSIPYGKAKVVTEKMIDINLETGERSDAIL